MSNAPAGVDAAGVSAGFAPKSAGAEVAGAADSAGFAPNRDGAAAQGKDALGIIVGEGGLGRDVAPEVAAAGGAALVAGAPNSEGVAAGVEAAAGFGAPNREGAGAV
jgi:hypothetical protein